MGILKGKVAVVTGAGRGIGREVALELARQGAKVVVNDYGVSVDGENPSSEVAEQVVEEIKSQGGHAVANAQSVASMSGAEDLIQTAIRQFGDLDILVCAAGILRERMIFNMTEDEWDSVINVHLKGHFAPMHFATKYLREKRKGRIVSFTSAAGLEGNPGQANYSAAKAGIIGLTMSTALAMGKYNVTCNAIAPVADTRMTSNLDNTPIAKLTNRNADCSPKHIAPVVAFLASDKASHITGQIIGVEGRRIFLYNHHKVIKTMYSAEDWTLEKISETYDQALGTDRLIRFEKMGLIEPK